MLNVESVKLKIKNLGLLILDVLYPKKCLGCGREGNYICNKCELFMIESENVLYLVKHIPMTSVWEYNGVVKEIIHKIKYRGVSDAIKELVGRFVVVMGRSPENFNDLLHYIYEEKPVITYVPIHWRRKRKRGFNQSEIIAKELGKIFNLPVVKMLKKVKNTKSQTKLNEKERLENVRDSFGVQKGLPLQMRNILLVDDVSTSGATMNECCRVLKESGVEKIWQFTLAKTT